MERLAEAASKSTTTEPAAVLRTIELGEGARRGKAPGPSRTPRWAIFRRIDPQLPTIELEIVERCDCVLSFLVGGELDERETARAARLSIRPDVHTDDLPGRREGLAQPILRGVEAQVADEYFPWNGESSLSSATGPYGLSRHS